VVRGAEEPRQGGGAGVTAAAAINGRARWGGRFRERKGAGRLRRRRGSASRTRGKERRRGEGESTPGSGGGRRGREVGGRLRWETALTGGPHLSAACVRGKASGPAGVGGPRWFGPRGGKRKR
jgi:hypothetical protein